MNKLYNKCYLFLLLEHLCFLLERVGTLFCLVGTLPHCWNTLEVFQQDQTINNQYY